MPEQAFVFPTSFAQQRLWFLNQLLPDSPFYNIHTAVPLSMPLDYEALRRSLQEIVSRHETLRSRFTVVEGEPMQVVAAEMDLPLPVVDLSQLKGAARQAEALRRASEESRQPFDLATGPLVRTGLLRLGQDEHVLLITMHHIISDAWSMGVFFRELRELYTAFVFGRPSPLPELPIQYADFAVWQREWLSGEVLETQLGYWRQRLSDLPALELPADRRRPPIASFRGASHAFQLPSALAKRLRALGREEGCTLFMVLLAAFKVLLSRYSGQEDVVVGAPIANRNRAEIEPLIGFFVNTLVLRSDLSGDPPFGEVLARVREVTLGAYAHQDLPFEKLVEELQPERDLSRNPLFQVTFQMHNAPSVTELAAAQGPSGEPGIDVQRGTSNFDLACEIWENGSRLEGRFDYSSDLFDAPTMVRMAGHFRVLLDGIVADPGVPVSSLPLLTEAERRQPLVEANATRTEYPREATVHSLFAAQAARTPDAVAVVAEEARLTYAELERRANRIAHWLREQGVGPERLVGICIERSADMIVGLLAILQAGGAYVALDPGDPRPRLELVAADAGIVALLTHTRFSELLGRAGLPTLCLDGDRERLALYPELPPESGAGADDLAYVAYTSGSTGRPKGVCVVHRGVVRLVQGTDYVDLGPAEVVLQFSPISFDASTFEIWGCLLNGGRLVVHPAGPASLEELGRTLVRHGVTTAWLTAGLFHQMVDEQLESLLGVRQLLAGGDVVSAAHVRKLLQAPGRRRFINGYGPTEGTTFTCCHSLTRAEDVGDMVPIGRPIANTRVYVLDRRGEPVPIGIPGELHIGGDGLARGYLNSPELTAQKFVPDPFEPGERLYRSGDLVRYRGDGVLEFLGRLDRQVKVRGFRVEPGEIESALAAHPAVASVAVVPCAGPQGDRSLSAFLVLNADRMVPAAELRAYLQERLPGYLVPSELVAVESLPLTPNGKVDTARLLDERDLPRERPDAYVPPTTEVEEALVAIWEQVLHRERVGIHDDFFADLGGHSLLGTQLVSRVRESFGIELPLRRLFEYPTVARLAVAVEEAILEELEALGDDGGDPSAADAAPAAPADPLPLEGVHG